MAADHHAFLAAISDMLPFNLLCINCYNDTNLNEEQKPCTTTVSLTRLKQFCPLFTSYLIEYNQV